MKIKKNSIYKAAAAIITMIGFILMISEVDLPNLTIEQKLYISTGLLAAMLYTSLLAHFIKQNSRKIETNSNLTPAKNHKKRRILKEEKHTKDAKGLQLDLPEGKAILYPIDHLASHDWANDNMDQCEKCGDKDWMPSSNCSESILNNITDKWQSLNQKSKNLILDVYNEPNKTLKLTNTNAPATEKQVKTWIAAEIAGFITTTDEGQFTTTKEFELLVKNRTKKT